MIDFLTATKAKIRKGDSETEIEDPKEFADEEGKNLKTALLQILQNEMLQVANQSDRRSAILFFREFRQSSCRMYQSDVFTKTDATKLRRMWRNIPNINWTAYCLYHILSSIDGVTQPEAIHLASFYIVAGRLEIGRKADGNADKRGYMKGWSKYDELRDTDNWKIQLRETEQTMCLYEKLRTGYAKLFDASHLASSSPDEESLYSAFDAQTSSISAEAQCVPDVCNDSPESFHNDNFFETPENRPSQPENEHAESEIPIDQNAPGNTGNDSRDTKILENSEHKSQEVTHPAKVCKLWLKNWHLKKMASKDKCLRSWIYEQSFSQWREDIEIMKHTKGRVSTHCVHELFRIFTTFYCPIEERLVMLVHPNFVGYKKTGDIPGIDALRWINYRRTDTNEAGEVIMLYDASLGDGHYMIIPLDYKFLIGIPLTDK